MGGISLIKNCSIQNNWSINWSSCHYHSLQGKTFFFAVSSMQSNNLFIRNKDFFILIKRDLPIIVQLFTVSIDFMNFISFPIKHCRSVYLLVRSIVVIINILQRVLCDIDDINVVVSQTFQVFVSKISAFLRFVQ